MWHPLGWCRLHSNPNSSPFDFALQTWTYSRRIFAALHQSCQKSPTSSQWFKRHHEDQRYFESGDCHQEDRCFHRLEEQGTSKLWKTAFWHQNTSWSFSDDRLIFQCQHDQSCCTMPWLFELTPVTKCTLLRGSQINFFLGRLMRRFHFMLLFSSLWLNLTFEFFFQWATTVLAIMEKVELDRNAPYLHLPQLHVQSQYLNLSAWLGSWIAALPPQKMRHQVELPLRQKTKHQRSPLLLQVLPSFNYLGGHLVQDQDRHLLHVKNLKENHLLWHLLQDASHSSGQEHWTHSSDSRSNNGNWVYHHRSPRSCTSTPYSSTCQPHVVISLPSTNAFDDWWPDWRGRLGRKHLQIFQEKSFFWGGRMQSCFLWPLFQWAFLSFLHSLISIFLSSCFATGSNNPNFLIGSILRSLLDGRRISGSPTTVPHSRPYQRYLEPFGLWLHFDFRTSLLIYADAGSKHPTFTSTRRRRHYIARVRKTPSTLVQMQLYPHVSSYPSSSDLPSHSSCYTFTITSQFFIQLARNITSKDKLRWCGSHETALWEELPRRGTWSSLDSIDSTLVIGPSTEGQQDDQVHPYPTSSQRTSILSHDWD